MDDREQEARRSIEGLGNANRVEVVRAGGRIGHERHQLDTLIVLGRLSAAGVS